MNSQTDILTYAGPIFPNARRKAEEFCSQFPKGDKAEKVRLNTLAVLFVNSYLQCMGVETDLEASDSQNILYQMYLDTADLSLANNVFLECLPVLEGESFVYVPPESQSNRMGYVAVQINQSFREAKILGFIKEVQNEYVSINQFQSLDNLLEELEHQEEANSVSEINSNVQEAQSKVINLRQWFNNVIDTGWQEISTLFNTTEANLAFATRSAKNNVVSRGKLINLGTNIEKQVILIVTVTPENEGEMDVVVEIHPIVEETYLFPHLSLSVLDADGEAVMEAHTRHNNKNIQLEFSNDLDESFNLKMTLGDVSIIESFIT
ncbi:MAG: DUF1822 family protein [Nostocaceae cyanobacterium]|nr:DUF1822 family protein [Nostocaceae cyanobacterium]